MYIFVYSVRVLATLTADVGRILSKLHQVQPNGDINFSTGIRIAHVISHCIYIYIITWYGLKIYSILFVNVILVGIKASSRKKS